MELFEVELLLPAKMRKIWVCDGKTVGPVPNSAANAAAMRAVCRAITISIQTYPDCFDNLVFVTTGFWITWPARWLQDRNGKFIELVHACSRPSIYEHFGRFCTEKTAVKPPRSHGWRWLFGTRWLNPIKLNQSVFNPVSK